MNTDFTGIRHGGQGPYVPLNGSRVRREFTAQEAQTSVPVDTVFSEDQYALFLAQKAYEYTSATVTQAQIDDDGSGDRNGAPGRVVKHERFPEGEVSLEASFGHNRIEVVHHRRTTTEAGTEVVNSFFRQDGEGKVLGYDDGVSAVEVVVAPNGALTVFTDT